MTPQRNNLRRRRRCSRLVIVTCWALAAAAPAAADWPQWVEQWLFNPTERTRRGIESFSEGEAAGAVDPLETALRLEGDHPVTQYNAGTARLGSGTGDAASLLEAAAQNGSPELASSARYNLGNARMAGQDLPGAIEAYKEALKHNPSFEDAKFNLELAQRLLKEQQQQKQDQQQNGDQQDEQDQQQQESDQQNEQDQQQEGDQEQQDQQQNEQDQQNEQEGDQQQQQQQPEQGDEEQQQQPPEQNGEEQQQQQQQESPLPQFQDLPDMTAEEAAAILEAIENMEREDRRQEALEAAKKHSRGKKDW